MHKKSIIERAVTIFNWLYFNKRKINLRNSHAFTVGLPNKSIVKSIPNSNTVLQQKLVFLPFNKISKPYLSFY